MVILAKLAFPFDPAKTAVIVVSCIRETSLRRLYYDVRVTLLPLVISAVFAVLCSSIFVCLALTTISIQRRLLAPHPISASTIVSPVGGLLLNLHTNNGTSNGNRGTCLAQPLDFLLLPGGLC